LLTPDTALDCDESSWLVIWTLRVIPRYAGLVAVSVIDAPEALVGAKVADLTPTISIRLEDPTVRVQFPALVAPVLGHVQVICCAVVSLPGVGI
jgi:hypothetical protein